MPMLLYLTGCVWEISERQKTGVTNLAGSPETSSQETNNSKSPQTIQSDSVNSNNTLPDNSDEEKESTDISSDKTGAAAESGAKNCTESSGEDAIENNLGSQRYAVIASGASLNSQHYKWFLNSTNMAYKLLKNSGYIDENIYYLFENSKELYVDYEATINNFKKITAELQEKTKENDNIILFLIGHGSYSPPNSYYALDDYNLSDIELAEMFKNIKRNKLIFVFSPCNSGGFVDNLSGKNTVVITSARKDESNRAAFIEPFLTSFDGMGDTDKDGKVSFEEAFNYACVNVKEQFAANGWGTLTEHAQLDDNGDKISHEYPLTDTGDGLLSKDIYLK